MTPFVTDQIAAAPAFVSLEINTQPDKLLPSNNSTRFVGVAGDGSACANKDEVVAMRNVSARQLLKKGFIGAELVCASGKAQAGIGAYPPSSDSGVTGCVWAVNNYLTG